MQCMMGTDFDFFLASDSESIYSDDIKYAWYFKQIIENILFSFVMCLLAIRCVFLFVWNYLKVC